MYSKNYMKKIGSLALAGVMAASLSIPAFASSTNQQTQVNAVYTDIPIAVTVPQAGTAAINPYGLPYEVKDKTNTNVLGKIIGEQISSQPMYISNDGTDVDLSVGATVSAEIPSGSKMTFATASTANSKVTTKQAFVYLEVESTDLTDMYKTTNDTGATVYVIDPDAVAEACVDEDGDLWQDYDKTATNMIVVGTTAASKPNMVTLAKMTDEEHCDEGSVAVFRLAGDCVTAPDEAWTTSDKFTATIAFTFTPVSE
jgi:hypothetical protein